MPFHTTTSSSSSSSYSTYTSTSSNFSLGSGSGNGNDSPRVTGHRCAKTSQTDPSGYTTVRSGYQNLGEDPVLEERRYDSRGREQALPAPVAPGGDSMAGGTRRIQDLEDEEEEGF
ncbi:hypothetical protein BO70DRAFT_358397 [Aspergillus heteromorphus CBS 117.55]|uniref:Uncharacterized protein n=1 Tax=Aspergillus heteromorphus CBS 117.55 TaxID=1448321 RepID=A0A317X045_9EURO|nr:uncharacterized protein BO70DRAFT_358397 [Aspergillus heteromorphus CBS 117.55]PWY90927.1 hypothetical protein BO70DRAFT_358397 [Aspergillus heteromorphus CBS 117.55]